jgi:multidrug resistance efflux pump
MRLASMAEKFGHYVALARSEVDEARARYEQARRDLASATDETARECIADLSYASAALADAETHLARMIDLQASAARGAPTD